MGVLRTMVVVTGAASIVATALVGGAGAAAARPAAPDVPGSYTLTLTRVSNAHAVVVRWGDGTTSRRTSPCTPAQVSRRPAACTMRFTHVYPGKGTYQVTTKWGPQVVGRDTVRVGFVPRGWRPPARWVQPAGWLPYDAGATFAACATVPWYYDATGQPPAAARMQDDVVAGLALVGAQTGLRFVPTTDRAKAQLVFGWADLTGYGSGVAGFGGYDADSAYVRFSTTNWWPADTWAGFDVVTQPDGTTGVGRGWLVVHETMHAIGFDHVADETSIMNPITTAHALNAGDLDGLHTMYPTAACG